MTNTLFTGKVYYRFDELPSTNDYARDLLAKSRPSEGTVVRAASQSAGRGQFGSSWVAEPGANLTLSVILYPNWLTITEQFRLSEAVALAVRDAVSITVDGSPCTIKWPNDIYLNDRKTAGILIQNTLSGSQLEASVVGIGLNVNQTLFSTGAPNATSLALATGRTFDLDQVADALLERLEYRYLQLKSGQSQELRAAYQSHLYSFGTTRDFIRPDGSVFSGTIQGVQTDGRLAVSINGNVELFAVKAIQMLPS